MGDFAPWRAQQDAPYPAIHRKPHRYPVVHFRYPSADVFPPIPPAGEILDKSASGRGRVTIPSDVKRPTNEGTKKKRGRKWSDRITETGQSGGHISVWVSDTPKGNGYRLREVFFRVQRSCVMCAPSPCNGRPRRTAFPLAEKCKISPPRFIARPQNPRPEARATKAPARAGGGAGCGRQARTCPGW